MNDPTNYQTILDAFHHQAGLQELTDGQYIQTLYQNTFRREANNDELNGYLMRLQNGDLDRDCLAIDLANSEEAFMTIGNVILFDHWV